MGLVFNREVRLPGYFLKDSRKTKRQALPVFFANYGFG